MFVWGTNFVLIKVGLVDFPPFLFATLRFALSALPWLFFVPRPQAAWSKLIAFGVLQGGGQFGLLFLAMRSDISPGLASLVIQSQVFFTILASVVLFGERIGRLQVAALGIAAMGLFIIAWRSATAPSAAVTLTGLMLTLAAGAGWAASNLIARSSGRVNMLRFMVWSSLFAVPPLVALELWFDGIVHARAALAQAGFATWGVVLWQAVGNTLFGFGVWNWLLSRHPSAVVAPFALLVPVFGIGASAILLHEPLPAWKISATAMVLLALAINVYSTRRRQTKPS